MKPGSVPTARVAPFLRDLIADRWPYGGGLDVLSEKVGCDWGSIAGIIDQTHEWCEFNLADKLLCGLGRPDLWWGALNDVYWDADLSRETCIRDGCGVTFVPRKGGRNGPDARQIYCSRRCAHMHWKVRKGIVKDGRKRNLKTHCRNGHKRTPDNQVKRGGYMTCAECVRDRRGEARIRRSPERVERERRYQRDYYQRRKAAA